MNANNIVDINPIGPEQLVDQARMAFAVGRLLHVVGQGGGGKTSILSKVVGPALGRRVIVINLSGASPMEYVGYGIPHEAPGGVDPVTGVQNYDMAFSAPEIWPILRRVGDEPIMVILDEFADWDPAGQALCRGLFPAAGEMRIGSHVLGSNVVIATTGNTKRHGSSQSRVESAPFTERGVKVTLRPNVPAWVTWWESDAERAKIGSFVPSFLQWGSTVTKEDGSNDHFNPPIVMPYDGSPHPCPRTWEAVALAEPFRLQERETFRRHVFGSVGEAAGNAFLAYLNHADKVPAISKAVQDPGSYKMPEDPAQQYAVANAALVVLQTSVAGSDPDTAVAAGKADWFVDLALRMNGEIKVFAASSAVARGIPVDEHAKRGDLFL